MSFVDAVVVGVTASVIASLITDEIRERRKQQQSVFEQAVRFVWDTGVAVATAIWDFVRDRLSI
jgi:hypothetical protein